MPYSTQLPPSGSAYYVEKAPQAAFVLTIIGLALAILGFSVITIIPGILCCIIGLALNAHYENEEMINPRKTPTLVIGVIGIIVSIVAAVFFVGFGMLSAQFIQEPDGGGDRGAIVESKSSSSSAGESASAKTSSSLRIDPKAFDDKGNVTLYALFELTGEALQEELEARGYKWIENAHAWMASGGAAFEVQNNEGIMSRDDIDRLEEGAIFTSVAYAVTIVGYDTPAAALEGLSEAVVVEDTCADFEGGIVFALVYGSDKEEHLAAISDVGDKQQTILVFSQDAVEEGLFSEITGVSSGKSIDKIWKALNGK